MLTVYSFVYTPVSSGFSDVFHTSWRCIQRGQFNLKIHSWSTLYNPEHSYLNILFLLPFQSRLANPGSMFSIFRSPFWSFCSVTYIKWGQIFLFCWTCHTPARKRNIFNSALCILLVLLLSGIYLVVFTNSLCGWEVSQNANKCLSPVS